MTVVGDKVVVGDGVAWYGLGERFEETVCMGGLPHYT